MKVLLLLDQNGTGFVYLKQKFPRMKRARSEGGIFVGLQIREVMRNSLCDET
jgi:hypothetical protein